MNLLEIVETNKTELNELVGQYNTLVQQLQNGEAQRRALEIEILAKQRVIEQLETINTEDKPKTEDTK